MSQCTKMYEGCPCNLTEESDTIQNYGCLLDWSLIGKMKIANAVNVVTARG